MDAEARITASTMMALRAHQQGGPEQMVDEETPRPTLAAGEVRTCEADGVNRTPSIPWLQADGVNDQPLASMAGPVALKASVRINGH